RLFTQTSAVDLANHIHALDIHTYTPQEWQQMKQESPESPMCLGGSHKSAQ
ncbi:BolA family transcriptional regulator, partial [Vibrio cholerae O1]|nr:BolA family transcriptional regulator [Vibrio cholerae O1]